jgi:8-oxo-dGTP pyrophosphatase MutT (NUDIX family)
MKQAVCVVIQDRISRFLAVSRRYDTTQWGFPGGKVDPGESNVEAAAREVYEETGYYPFTKSLIPIYSGVCLGKDGCDFWVTTYMLDELVVRSNIHFNPEEGLAIKWVTENVLTDSIHCPFAEYNKEVFLKINQYVTNESYNRT